MPCLHLVQSGAHGSKETTKIQLLISYTCNTAQIERTLVTEKIKPRYHYGVGHGSTLLFCFLRAGEVTVPTIAGFNNSKNIVWGQMKIKGEMKINDETNLQLLRVHLKQSKTDQLGKGIDVYIGKTAYPLCPVVAVMVYMHMTSQGPKIQGHFSNQPMATPLPNHALPIRSEQACKILSLTIHSH